MIKINTLQEVHVGNAGAVYYSNLIYDDDDNVLYASCIGNGKQISELFTNLKKNKGLRLQDEYRSYLRLRQGGANYIKLKEKDSLTGYVHLIYYTDDQVLSISEGSEELHKQFIHVFEGETVERKLYEKLYDTIKLPIKEEWASYIIEKLRNDNRYDRGYSALSLDGMESLEVYKITYTETLMTEYIREGLISGEIQIQENAQTSMIMEQVEGLDSYLNLYGETLASRIQESFVPKFDSATEAYSEYTQRYDDSCYYNDINLHTAQRNVIQAGCNHLDVNKNFLLVGEMGCGKTLLSAGITYSNYRKDYGMTNIVMCPTHLVKKWKREIETLTPNAKAYIISSIGELKEIESHIFDENKKEHSFIILSKESAKNNYEKMPNPIWNEGRKHFTCPDCGRVLYEKLYKTENGVRACYYNPIRHTGFTKENIMNGYCLHAKDPETGVIAGKGCGAKLWAPFIKAFDSKWVKVGKRGWFLKTSINKLIAVYEAFEIRTKADQEFLDELYVWQRKLRNSEQLKGVKAPRKYDLSKYIKDKYKTRIDYLILDEFHLYKGDSQQGMAANNLIVASNKVIALTGTLLNGYASGIFYLLFRTKPLELRADNFEYNSVTSFYKKYGVYKEVDNYRKSNNEDEYHKTGSSDTKELPGVSPLLFTKFLLESTAFLALDDMDGGLPAYSEIPIEIEMDEILKDTYSRVEKELKELAKPRAVGPKILGASLQSMLTFPDMPYNQPPVVHPDTKEIVYRMPTLSEGYRPKEYKVLELVRDKIAKGEKVLIYSHFTLRTDCQEKLYKLISDAGYKVEILKSGKASSIDREEWIQKKLKGGLQVLICNPKLVETGLDLLDFTTIIFYQLGYDIFTMRQASRRSFRLSQTKDIEVYFLYYKDTMQQTALSLMASKLQASMSLEGKMSEEALAAMAGGNDILMDIASNLINGIRASVDVSTMQRLERKERIVDENRDRFKKTELYFEKPKRKLKKVVLEFEDIVIPKKKRKIRELELSFEDIVIPKKKRKKAVETVEVKENTNNIISDVLSFKIPLEDLI